MKRLRHGLLTCVFILLFGILGCSEATTIVSPDDEPDQEQVEDDNRTQNQGEETSDTEGE